MKILSACFRSVVNFFVEILFGCSHARQTRPFTIGEETYKVCLGCGKQIYYSAQEMRPLSATEVRRLRTAHAGEVKVMPIPASGAQLVPAHEHKTNFAA